MKKKNNIHNNIDWDMFLEEDVKEKFNDKLQDILKTFLRISRKIYGVQHF